MPGALRGKITLKTNPLENGANRKQANRKGASREAPFALMGYTHEMAGGHLF